MSAPAAGKTQSRTPFAVLEWPAQQIFALSRNFAHSVAAKKRKIGPLRVAKIVSDVAKREQCPTILASLPERAGLGPRCAILETMKLQPGVSLSTADHRSNGVLRTKKGPRLEDAVAATAVGQTSGSAKDASAKDVDEDGGGGAGSSSPRMSLHNYQRMVQQEAGGGGYR